MNLIKIKQAAFLLDTIAFYNSDNRALDYRGKCVYSPIDNISPGCAIGRHLDTELAAKLDQYSFSGIEETGNTIFDQLPEKLKELTQPFLYNVQNLHDRRQNFTKDGISLAGIEFANTIIDTFKLPIKKLK